ncbi:MAG: NAD(+)/NADH kinase [Planctomycetota bacterium]
MPTAPLKLIILTGSDTPHVRHGWAALRPWLAEQPNVSLVGEFSPSQPIPPNLDADMVVVLGGDGSILRGCRQLGARQLPILGINLGRLGFLADLSPQEFQAGLHLLCSGHYSIVEHLMFQCIHQSSDGMVHCDLGLNEVTITSGGSFKMLDIDLRIDDEEVTTFSCDGLIISTPVGSTAHNLSAGGPILRQELQVFVITPICPHTLTVRPIVDSASRTYRLRVKESPPGVMLVIDGQIRRPLMADDHVLVQRAQPTLKLVRLPGHSYYGTLHRKLGWQGQLDYRERRGIRQTGEHGE